MLTRIEYHSSKTEILLVTSINKVVVYYKSHGLHVVTMFVDLEFQFLEEKVFSTALNTTGARDHVPELERQIQVIKEWMQALHANLPFPSLTRRTAM